MAATPATITDMAFTETRDVSLPRLTFVAYPTSLTLNSANAIHTWSLTQALRAQLPDMTLLVPRFARRPSRFGEVGAVHLARVPFNAGRHLIDSIGWSYAERTWFAARVLLHLVRQRVARQAVEVLYVRDAVIAAWLALLARPLVGARVVYECHDLERQNPSAQRGLIARRLAACVDRVALRHADGVVSLTQAFTTALAARPDVRPRGPVAVIPDAYDDAVFFPQARQAACDALGLDREAFIIVYAGSTWKYRGVDRLIAAFATFAAERPDARLLLVGGRPSERAELAKEAARRGVHGSVECVGTQSQSVVAQYLAAADVLVLPDTVSKASASPLKLFEYAACARPIALVDLPALREILPNDGAYWVPPSNGDALADAFRWLAANPDAAARMGERAAWAVAPYTYRVRAAAVIAFCARIAEGMR